MAHYEFEPTKSLHLDSPWKQDFQLKRAIVGTGIRPGRLARTGYESFSQMSRLRFVPQRQEGYLENIAVLLSPLTATKRHKAL
jgi:hypothetical protein